MGKKDSLLFLPKLDRKSMNFQSIWKKFIFIASSIV